MFTCNFIHVQSQKGRCTIAPVAPLRPTLTSVIKLRIKWVNRGLFSFMYILHGFVGPF